MNTETQIEAEACKCWSCDSQCGNSQEYCGPLARRGGHLLCQYSDGTGEFAAICGVT